MVLLTCSGRAVAETRALLIAPYFNDILESYEGKVQ